MAGFKGKVDLMFKFVAFWSFHSSGMVNSFLFLILYATVRKQIIGLFSPLLCMCGLKQGMDFDIDPSGTSSKRNTKRSSLSTSSNNDSKSVVSVSSMEKCNPSIDCLSDPSAYKIKNADFQPLSSPLPIESRRVVNFSQNINLQKETSVTKDYINNGYQSDDNGIKCNDIDIIESVYGLSNDRGSVREKSTNTDTTVSFSFQM